MQAHLYHIGPHDRAHCYYQSCSNQVNLEASPDASPFLSGSWLRLRLKGLQLGLEGTGLQLGSSISTSLSYVHFLVTIHQYVNNIMLNCKSNIQLKWDRSTKADMQISYSRQRNICSDLSFGITNNVAVIGIGMLSTFEKNCLRFSWF